MTARARITPAEFDALQRRRQASAEAAAKGRAHRALPLDVVEARERAKRKPWPNVCPQCNTGTHEACDCMPPEAASACSQFLADPPRRKPPAVPWRDLGAGLLVLLLTISAVHVVVRAFPPSSQVAAR